MELFISGDKEIIQMIIADYHKYIGEGINVIDTEHNCHEYVEPVNRETHWDCSHCGCSWDYYSEARDCKHKRE